MNDNFAVSKYFKEKLNFLILPTKGNESYFSFNDSIFKFNKLNKILIKFFTDICDFSLLSSNIETKIDLERDNLNTESIEIPTCITNLLPYIQHYLNSKPEYFDIYTKFKQRVDDTEINLKMYQINTVNLSYFFKPNRDINSGNNNENKIHVRLNNNNNNIFEYYIRKDNEKELFKGFLKIFFTTSVGYFEKLEKDLLNFILYVNNSYLKTTTTIQSLSSSDKYELENDYDIKLTLPINESFWLIKDVVGINNGSIIKTTTTKKLNNTLNPNYQQIVDPLFSVYTELAREQQSLLNELSLLPSANSRNYVATNRSSTVTTFQLNNNNNNNLIAENSLNNFTHKGNLNSKLFLTQNFSKSEVIIDDLTHEFRVTNSSEIKIEMNNKVSSESLDNFKNKVGRWGELYIYKMLLNKYNKEIQLNLIKIEWINQYNETGHPYDLKFTRYDENDWGGEPQEEIYIEVKSTSKSDNELNDYFPVSVKEVLFAMNNSANYHIYHNYHMNHLVFINFLCVLN